MLDSAGQLAMDIKKGVIVAFVGDTICITAVLEVKELAKQKRPFEEKVLKPGRRAVRRSAYSSNEN